MSEAANPEAAATTPAESAPALPHGVTREDYALFEQAANEGMARWIGALQQSCLEAIVLGRKFPLAEPEYSAKRPLALDAFEAALAGFKPERARAIDALLAAQDGAGNPRADGRRQAQFCGAGDLLHRPHPAL